MWIYARQLLSIHGLNQSPDAFEEYFEYHGLSDQYVIHKVELKGHRQNLDKKERLKRFKDVSKEDWYSDIDHVYKRIPANEPKVLIGYSLGALLGIKHAIDNGIKYDKIVLKAPALGFKSLGQMAMILKKLRFPKKIIVPGFSPRSYMANYGSPMIAYYTLFEIYRELKEQDWSVVNVPGLVKV